MKEQLIDRIRQRSEEYVRMSDAIFDHPEVGLEEYYAADLLTGYLEKEGFRVERGLAGLPTAFRAVWEQGKGGPSIGLLCEYDALKGFGHGCGHHMQGPAILGAAAALKDCVKDLPYRIIVYGTPGEENAAGKVTMLHGGCFRDIDVALMTHANPETNVDVKSLAMRSYQVEYFGRAAHAAIRPEEGRSALDALMLACHGVECLREHVRDDVRMHYAIRETSPLTNVVPAHTVSSFTLRSESSRYLDELSERLFKVLHGAAMMTETEVTIVEKSHLDNKIPVFLLNDLLMDNARRIQAPQLGEPRKKTGSTDFGNVMHEIPGSCIRIAFVPKGTSSHSQEYLDAGKSEAAHQAVIAAAEILAMTAWDLISREGLLDQIRAEFKRNLEEMG